MNSISSHDKHGRVKNRYKQWIRWINISLGPSPSPLAFLNAIKGEGVFSLPQCKTFLHSLALSNTAAVGNGLGCGG